MTSDAASPALPAKRWAVRTAWKYAGPWCPEAVASAVFLVLLAVFVQRDKLANDGHLIYPLDDAYSHMAIAKNLALHRVWGFSAIDGFSSGGSSLIWPLLLATGFALFGVHEWPPLALNAIASVAFLFYAGWMIRGRTRSRVASLALLLAILFLTSFPAMAGAGMEHCWQCLICLVFLALATDVLAHDEPAAVARRARRILPALAFAMTMVRYEGLFLVGIVVLLLLIRRELWLAAWCAAASGLPVLVSGGYALSKGWCFLPNSLLLKASIPPLGSWKNIAVFLEKGYSAMFAHGHMVALVAGLIVALLLQWRRRETLWNRPTLLLTLLLGGSILHLQFAGLDWLFHYEDYLLAIGILAIGLTVVEEAGIILATSPTWFEKGQRLGLLALGALLFCTPLWTRANKAWTLLVPASHNIYEQQYQMAHFLRQSYRDKGVAANDIGAIDFFVNIGLVDLFGLGTMEVAQAKLDGRYTQDVVRHLIAQHGVRLVMVYTEWAKEYGGLPPEWVPVGQWTIPDNVVCSSDTVTFFAPNPTLVPELTDALRQYAPHLPPGVMQAGFYRGQSLPHVQGTYPPETDDGGTFYWTSRTAQFALNSSAKNADAMLQLSTRTLAQGVTLDVTFNGQPISSRQCQRADVGSWMKWAIKVRRREGYSFVNITARGGEPVTPPGDSRKLLVAIREPKWTFDPQLESLPAARATP